MLSCLFCCHRHVICLTLLSLMRLFLLAMVVVAQEWLQYSWNALECEGLPDTISFYPNISQSRAVYHYTYYGWMIEPYCGTASTVLESKYCCRTSINRRFSEGLGSFVVEPRASLDLETNSGTKYCKLSSSNANYNVQYISLNTCADYRYTCNDTLLNIFPEAECKGTPESFPLNGNNSVLIQSTLVGQIRVDIKHVQLASNKYTWTTIFPPTDFVPIHKHLVEYFGTIFLRYRITNLSSLYYNLYSSMVWLQQGPETKLGRYQSLYSLSFQRFQIL
jgi:hypothetical protein